MWLKLPFVQIYFPVKVGTGFNLLDSVCGMFLQTHDSFLCLFKLFRLLSRFVLAKS